MAHSASVDAICHSKLTSASINHVYDCSYSSGRDVSATSCQYVHHLHQHPKKKSDDAGTAPAIAENGVKRGMLDRFVNEPFFNYLIPEPVRLCGNLSITVIRFDQQPSNGQT